MVETGLYYNPVLLFFSGKQAGKQQHLGYNRAKILNGLTAKIVV